MTNCSWVHCKTLESNFSIIFRLHLLLTAHHLLISQHLTAKLTALCWDLGCFGTVLGPPWAIWGPHWPTWTHFGLKWSQIPPKIEQFSGKCRIWFESPVPNPPPHHLRQKKSSFGKMDVREGLKKKDWEKVWYFAKPGGAQCLGGSTILSFSKCFRNRFFCIFCKPHTYSQPFLANLDSFGKIWSIYGYSHFLIAKIWAKLG